MTTQPNCQERINENYTRTMTEMKTCLEYNTSDDLQNRIYEIENELEWLEPAVDQDYITEISEELEELENRQQNTETVDGFMEDVLSMDVKISINVCLSTGGPADGIKLNVSKGSYGLEIDSAEYYFQDWFDGATKNITGSDLDNVKQMFDPYIESMEIA